MIFDRKRHWSGKNHPFDICLNSLIKCTEGWCVGLGLEGVAWEWRELSEITWNGVGTEKEGTGNKDLKKRGEGGGGKLGEGVGALNRGGGGS